MSELDAENQKSLDDIMREYGLQRRQALFCLFYAQTFNQRKAARLAGYATPEVEGSRLIRNASVRRYLETLWNEAQASAAEILATLAVQARADVADFIDPTNGEVILDSAMRAGNTRAIKKLKVRTYTNVSTGEIRREYDIELHDSARAAELLGKAKLGRAAGLFGDSTTKPEETPPVEALPDSALEDAARRALDTGAITPDDVYGSGGVLPADPRFEDDPDDDRNH